jgi:hypothetical protein
MKSAVSNRGYRERYGSIAGVEKNRIIKAHSIPSVHNVAVQLFKMASKAEKGHVVRQRPIEALLGSDGGRMERENVLWRP